jgi:hypothetical protein
MLNGKIFQEITGKSIDNFSSTIELWEEIKKFRVVRDFGNKQYGNNVVTPRGCVFSLKYFDSDIDKHIAEL